MEGSGALRRHTSREQVPTQMVPYAESLGPLPNGYEPS